MALAALLLAAHGVGSIFAHFRQPRAIGEVVGGLLLGPTLLRALAPGVHSWLFPDKSATATVLAAVGQLGLLFLMFVIGSEIKKVFHRDERRTVGAVFVTGMLIPFAAGIALVQLIDQRSHWGANGNSTSFLLVFAIAMAITSIPVISRIMYDLGILDTVFARIVLGVAVLEDLLLYVVLAIAIGYAGGKSGRLFGLPGLLGIDGGTSVDMIYHVSATVGFLAAFLLVGPAGYRWLRGLELNLIQRASPIAHQFTFMILATLAGLALGVEAFFGAFVAGIVVGATEAEPSEATLAIKSFSLAFFIPVYFAMIGLELDLLHGFSPLFFVFFLLAACLIKAFSVYLGARVAGESNFSSWNLAVAMNARGGPGIIVASTAFAAGIIDQPFYAVLILLAIVSSLLAGSWLARVPKERLLTRSETATGSSP
jgi:Kef-type K+ transport system membrane component KefB